MTAPVLRLERYPVWYHDAAQAPAGAAPRHPNLHRDAARAWQRVTTEPVLDHRHLYLPGDAKGAGELVSYYLAEHSPHWTGWEATAGIGPVWDGPAVYAPSPYGSYGGAGLGSEQAAVHALGCGIDLAASWGAQALVLPNLTPELARIARRVRRPDADLFVDYAYTLPVHPLGLAGHLAANPNRRAARGHSRAIRRAIEAGVRLHALRGQDLERALPAFADLARQVDVKHGTAKYGSDVIAARAAAPGAVLLAAVLEDQMVGAFLCHRYSEGLYLSTSGLDYDRLRSLHTYEWLMGASLQYAADSGARVLDAGRSNHAVKRRWGMTTTALHTLVYLTAPDPATSTALARLGEGLIRAATGAPVSASLEESSR